LQEQARQSITTHEQIRSAAPNERCSGTKHLEQGQKDNLPKQLCYQLYNQQPQCRTNESADSFRRWKIGRLQTAVRGSHWQ
jgi:hypothetical protein